MKLLGGLRHIHETGKLPDNRAEVDEACRDVLKHDPTNTFAMEWQDTSKGRRKRYSRSPRTKQQ